MRSLRTRIMSSRVLLPSTLGTLAAGAAAMFGPSVAFADDVQPKPPNVLLLLDDSGSMAYELPNAGNNNSNSSYPNCGGNNDALPNASAGKSRWTLLTEALTGSINGYGCTSGLNGRIYSNFCRSAANADLANNFNWNSTPWAWPLSTAAAMPAPASRGPINFPHYKKSGNNNVQDGTNKFCAVGSLAGTAGMPKFDQSADGVIDTFSKQIRFGLMTMDDEWPRWKDNSTQDVLLTGVIDLGGVAFYPGSGGWAYLGWEGGWSYWVSGSGNWDAQTNPHRGKYGRSGNSGVGTTWIDWDVGARNPYARPWEGRLMGFGSSDDPLDYGAQNDRIQDVILGLHPQTATPLAGLMSDADDFLLRDSQVLQNYPTAGKNFLMGPATDPATCRQSHIILITDGAPNTDMRDTGDGGPLLDYWTNNLEPCYQNGGQCPYQLPSYYAADLRSHNMTTYVIGLAMNTVRWKSGKDNADDCEKPGKKHKKADPDGNGEHCDTDCNTLDKDDFGPPGSKGKMCSGANGVWDHANDPGGKGDLPACCTLAEIALKGSNDQQGAFFPQDVNAIKLKFAQLLSDIAGSSTSRTVPTFAVAAPTIQINNNPQQPSGVPPASFEILSSLEVQVGSAIWGGHLERRRLTCDGTSETPIPQVVSQSMGDSYDLNMIANAGKRKFFTVVAENGGSPAVDSSLRPASANSDGLGSVDVTVAANQTVPDFPDKFDDRIDARLSASGLKTKDVLGINYNTSESNCVNLLQVSGNGAATETPCAEKTLIWYGGGINGLASDRKPSPLCQKCNPLGAIYHSSPVTVGPPVDYIRDEQYRNTFAIAGTGQGYRPTVTYAQTLDGQLHAFVTENNSPTNDGVYGSTPKPMDDTVNNELWAFVPPTVLPRIWPNFNVNASLLDGGLVVKDVIPFRTVAQAQDGTGTWKTILVGSSGESASGGYYYALDVTNPLDPKFLWQLRNDSTGQPLFGKAVPTAAIATLAIANGVPGQADQVSVAILAGGKSSAAIPTNVTSRRCGCAGVACAPCVPYARSNIRDWGDSETARSVTVVELTTGKILKRFVGEIDPPPVEGDQPVLAARVAAGFDSPMTGAPVAFPDTPGSNATRAYIGDADGTLWRLDFSNPDPSQWKASIAYDVYKTDYNPSGLAAPEIAGQPIEITPILSTDSAENPVIVFATGSQNGFQISTQGMRNYMVSITDKPTAFTSFTASKNVLVELKDGERVTGPMTLFDRSIYFSSYFPNNANPCNEGFPRIWGVNYINDTSAPPAGTGVNDPANGLDTDGNGLPDKRFVTLDQGAVIFGVGINRLPSCVTNATSFNDGWLAGAYKTDTVSAGKYELVVQTGHGTAAAPLGGEDLLSDPNQGAKTKSMHVNLPQPSNTLRVDSWTSVTE
ncbi:MAG: hypothetical protein U0414_34415 [Polyangiaceae bacterium]